MRLGLGWLRDEADIWRVSVILLLHLVVVLYHWYYTTGIIPVVLYHWYTKQRQKKREVFPVLKWVRDCRPQSDRQLLVEMSSVDHPPLWCGKSPIGMNIRKYLCSQRSEISTVLKWVRDYRTF